MSESSVQAPPSIVTPDTWRSLARTLVGEPELTSVELAAEAGVDLDYARRLWRALGFPPVPEEERVFTRSDLAMLRGVCRLLDEQGMAVDVVFQLTRVIGQSLARVAEAQVAAGAERLEALGAPTAAQDLPSRIEPAILAMEPFLGYVWRRHLLAALIRLSASRGGSSADRALVVGFADMVGFTAMSQQLSDRELAAVVERFEATAYENIPERGGRVVKMIGDEVMFSADDAASAAAMALALVEACARDETLPDVRVGMAIGPTLSWEGDLFGPTVNLASRLVSLARAGTVLLSEELGAQLHEQGSFSLRHLRGARLKGIGRVRTWVLRPPASEKHRRA